MNKMPEIDVIIKPILIIIGIILATILCINVIIGIGINKSEELEQRLIKQEEYMHQVQADVDNFKEVLK